MKSETLATQLRELADTIEVDGIQYPRFEMQAGPMTLADAVAAMLGTKAKYCSIQLDITMSHGETRAKWNVYDGSSSHTSASLNLAVQLAVDALSKEPVDLPALDAVVNGTPAEPELDADKLPF